MDRSSPICHYESSFCILVRVLSSSKRSSKRSSSFYGHAWHSCCSVIEVGSRSNISQSKPADTVLVAMVTDLTISCSCTKITLPQPDDQRCERDSLLERLMRIAPGAVLSGQPRTEHGTTFRIIYSRAAKQPWYPQCFARNLFLLIAEHKLKD